LHIILIITAATGQISLAQWFGSLTPELVFAGVLALALAGDTINTLWWVALGGAILSFIVGGIIGLYLILFGLLSAALLFIAHHYFNKPGLALALIIFLAMSLILELALASLYRAISLDLIYPATITAALAGLFYQLILLVNKQKEVIRFA
jgi:hypothetical protein